MSCIGSCRTLVAVTACAGLACLAPAARAQPVPPGFEIVRLTYDLGIHSRPDINDRGDVVWCSAYPPYESDIWLYRDGKVQQVTNDHWYDVDPDINDDGVIAWMRGDDWSPPFWVVFDAGQGVQAVPDPGGVSAVDYPQVTHSGEIVWVQRLGLNPSNDEIFSYDYKSGTFEQLTDNGLSNQGPRVNRYGDMVWTRYDFGVSPWTSTIMLYSGGQTFELSRGFEAAQAPDLNERPEVVWACGSGCAAPGLYLWQAGQAALIAEDGRAGRINKGGQIVFFRWNQGLQKWEMWLYRDAEFLQIPDMGVGFAGASINSRGEIAWREFTNTYGDTAVYLMRRKNVATPSTALDGDAPAGSGD